MAHAPDAILLTDVRGAILDANLTAVRLFGYTAPEELLGLGPEAWLTSKDRDQARSMLDQLAAQRPPARGAAPATRPAAAADAGGERALPAPANHAVRLDVLRRDGSPLPVEVAAGAAPAAGLLLCLRDLRHRLETERARDESAQMLRAVIEQSEDGIALMDTEGCIVEWNTALEAITGLSRGQVVGRAVWEVQGILSLLGGPRPDAAERVRTAVEPFLRTGQAPWLHELHQLELRLPDAEVRQVQVVAFPIRLGERWMAGAIARDVSQWVEMEERLLTARKLEAVGQLAGGVAHEFNNLLTVMNGYAQILRQRVPESAPLREAVNAIAEAGARAAALVRQLQTYARRQAAVVQPLDVNAILQTMRHRLNAVAREVMLGMNLASELPLASADRGQLESALLCLVENAGDAVLAREQRENGSYRGTIVIETACVTVGGGGALQHTLGLKRGRYVQVIIKDNGEGMTPYVQRHLFEPFFSTRGVGQGTGLGLAMVHGIMQQCDGAIHVESQEGRGTRVTLYLPAPVP